jgi:hypothetical protein
MKIHSLLAAALCVSSVSIAAEPLPASLAGSWKITRVLPSTSAACWNASQAQPLLGSTLVYRDDSMRWRGGEVPLQDVLTRSVTAAEFRQENSTLGSPPEFAELGIHTQRVTEVDLQHDDADITGATTEVPGDTVLIVAPNKIVVSACGVFFEATRLGTTARVTAHR